MIPLPVILGSKEGCDAEWGESPISKPGPQQLFAGHGNNFFRHYIF